MIYYLIFINILVLFCFFYFLFKRFIEKEKDKDKYLLELNESKFTFDDIVNTSTSKFNLNDIHLYIFNWKKVNKNSEKLYNEAKKFINNTKIINSDENYKFEDIFNVINLNDSYYYGGQYQTAIYDVSKNKIFGVIVGDVINLNFEKLTLNLLKTFNKYNTGVYSIDEKRTSHKKVICILSKKDNLKIVENTDCGIWFIHPSIVSKLRNIEYNKLTPYGWGIDIITNKESVKNKKLSIRDYSLSCTQTDFSTGYNCNNAEKGQKIIEEWYKKNIK